MNDCVRGHVPHDRIDPSLIRVASEHDGLYSAHAGTSRARIALPRKFDVARCIPRLTSIIFHGSGNLP
jgi:hypothetical protein